MKNVASFYYKFLCTHHARGACHHFGMGIPFVSKMQCITSIRMGSPYRSDSMHHARDVCKGICNRMMLHFSYYCKYEVLAFGDGGTGPADESKKTKRVQGWSRQIMGGRLLLFAIILLCEITTSFA